jgi:hypothetical protein
MARSRMRRSRNKRRRQRGGATSGWQPDGGLSAQAPYAMVNKSYDGCMAASRPGQIPFSMSGGLPGMRGGAYSVNVGSSLVPGVAAITRDASHCMRGGSRRKRHSRRRSRSRRHGRSRKQRGGVGALAAYRSDILTDGPAGYSQSAGAALNSVGAPILVNQPYNPVMMSKACSQTGGRRKSRKSRRSRYSKKMRGGDKCVHDWQPVDRMTMKCSKCGEIFYSH